MTIDCALENDHIVFAPNPGYLNKMLYLKSDSNFHLGVEVTSSHSRLYIVRGFTHFYIHSVFHNRGCDGVNQVPYQRA